MPACLLRRSLHQQPLPTRPPCRSPPQIAAAVGRAHGADACEALHRKQAAYLSIPKALQSAQAFAAIVGNLQKDEADKAAAGGGEASGGATEGAGSGGGAASVLEAALKREEEEEQEEEDGEEEGSEGRGRHARHGTPLRSGRRTPVSGVKRNRAGDIYDYYDEGEAWPCAVMTAGPHARPHG